MAALRAFATILPLFAGADAEHAPARRLFIPESELDGDREGG
jgi:hypothetical protein